MWWSKDGETWTQVDAPIDNSKLFSARDGHQVVVHDDQLWLIGGSDDDGRKNDVWRSEDGETWEEVRPDGESGSDHFTARNGHQVVVHDDQLWLIGGRDGGGTKNDVWRSEDGETWIRATNNERFSARSRHQVVVHNNRLWVIGGDDNAKNDVWYSEDGVNWTEATGSANFSERYSHQVVAYNNRLWVIGGWDRARKNDVWWSEDGENWRLGFHRVFQFR